jgi:hypothetical protein
MYWRQRAHINWLQFGDRNTSYFHNACSERKRRNMIGNLKKDDGGWVVNEKEKMEFITNHFVQLFRAGVDGIEEHSQQVLSAVRAQVTDEMNSKLMAEFTEEEVKNALESIGDLKAPGPDGLPSVFYKNFWDVVGEQLTREVLHVLNGGGMPEGWNDYCVDPQG